MVNLNKKISLCTIINKFFAELKDITQELYMVRSRQQQILSQNDQIQLRLIALEASMDDKLGVFGYRQMLEREAEQGVRYDINSETEKYNHSCQETLSQDHTVFMRE